MQKFRGIKALAAALSAVLICAAMTGCGRSDEELTAEATTEFESLMQTFQTGDVEQIKQADKSGDIAEDLNEITNANLTAAIFGALKNMTYTINSTTVTDDSDVRFNVTLNTINSSLVMQEYISSITTLVASPEYQAQLATMTKEDYDNLMSEQMINIINSGTIPTVENTVDVTLSLDNGSWEIKDSDEFMGLIYENVVDVLDEIVL